LQSQQEILVAIVSYNAGKTIERCLESLRKQETSTRFQVILVDSSTDNTAALARKAFPQARIMTSKRRLYCGDGRNMAIQASGAPLIAFLDADCYVESDWIESIVKAHRQSYPVVGGAIANGSVHSITAWAYYFIEFNIWVPARHAREMPEIAGCSLTMKRTAYTGFGPFIEQTYSSDTAFHWQLQKAGHQSLFDPGIKMVHTYVGGVSSLLDHIEEHRRAFAMVRSREKKFSRARSMVEMAALPLHPFLLIVIIIWRLRFSPGLYPVFLSSLPLVFAGLWARARGEFQGYRSYMKDIRKQDGTDG
jgi:GT2 family glycosyltransferase